MNLLEQLLLWLSYQNFIGGHSANILGVIWLISLMALCYQRFSKHFNLNNYYPQPPSKLIGSRNWRSYVWILIVLIFSFLVVFLMQMMFDDFVTTPIGILSGSWSLLAPVMGPFTFWKLLAFKWDVYAMISVYVAFLTLTKIWQFFHFTKVSAFLLILIIIYHVIVMGGLHLYYFLDLSGMARVVAYSITYPPFRVISAFFVASIIKKPMPALGVEVTPKISKLTVGDRS